MTEPNAKATPIEFTEHELSGTVIAYSADEAEQAVRQVVESYFGDREVDVRIDVAPYEALDIRGANPRPDDPRMVDMRWFEGKFYAQALP